MAVCLLTQFHLRSAAAENLIGVDVDDWVVYSVETTWHSNVPGQTTPFYLKDINHTEWRIQIEDVLFPEDVRFSVTIDFPNGTRKVDMHEGNIRTGSGNLSLWVVQRNLDTLDLVYEDKELRVNTTDVKAFAGDQREVAYAWFSQEEGEPSLTWKYHLFWDRDTGILCGELVTTTQVDEEHVTTGAIRITMSETSLWQPTYDDSWLFIGVGAAIAVAIGAIALKISGRSRSKTRKR
jgi:hypothetical protein